MNEVQRKVLRAHHGDILKNLILDTDILSFCVQKDILTDAMVQNIQAKPTQHEKIIEMLFMLPKRGPRAFPLFLEAVRKHSPYLCDKLEQEYDKEVKLSKWAEKVSQKAEDQKQPPIASHEDVSLEENLTADQTKPDPDPAKPATDHAKLDLDKPSDKPPDKSALHSPPSKVGSARKRSMSISSTNHVMTSSIMQQNLNMLYTKLRTQLESRAVREGSATGARAVREASAAGSGTPEPATFKAVDRLLDELFAMVEEQERVVGQCVAVLGGRGPNYPLVSRVMDVQRAKRDMEAELRSKEQQKNKYADHISKLENRARNQATEISHLNAEVKKLKEELEQLQVVSSEREEKQKIIDELRKMVMDADTSKKGKLRSSYLALHYDGNVTEIKQLRAEIRNLKADNENLKAENMMLKKSDSIKKLVKLREDGNQRHDDHLGSAVSHSSEDSRDSYRSRTRPIYPIQPAMYPTAGATSKATDNDKAGGYLSGQKPSRSFMSASVEQLTNLDNEDAATAKPIKVKDKDVQHIDFKFSDQNGSLGQKRSSSKDRASKRVTFYGDIDDDGNIGIRETSAKSETITSDFNPTNLKSAILTNGTGQGLPVKAVSKPEKPTRGRPPKLKNSKGASKRSASLNSITSSREIIKMSSHLIQRSRNLRQPVGH